MPIVITPIKKKKNGKKKNGNGKKRIYTKKKY